jgi:hypothetical protein
MLHSSYLHRQFTSWLAFKAIIKSFKSFCFENLPLHLSVVLLYCLFFQLGLLSFVYLLFHLNLNILEFLKFSKN